MTFAAHSRRGAWAASVFALALLLAAGARAESTAQPAGKPVRWDQARMTRYAEQLAEAVAQAREEVRKSPMSQNIAQRQTQYDLKEDMRLLANTTAHLASELKQGEGPEETLATFERIASLRLQAEEHGRRALIEQSVLDALVRAGAIHNQMKPYYYGKR
jgi:hypothetical protein